MEKPTIEIKDKMQSVFKRVVSSWLSWFIILGLIMMITFGYMENEYNKTQPSEEWSFGIKITSDAPNDYRKIGQTKRPNEEGIVVVYVVEDGLQLRELDWLGNIDRSHMIEMDSSKIKVVDISTVEDTYHVYVSNRKTLDRLDIDVASLSIRDKKCISNTSEQFAAIGKTVIVGDNNITEIIDDETILATFEGYEDLKRVRIEREGERIVATMDTIQGGNLIIVDGDTIIEKNLTTPSQQATYGYLKDIHIEDGVITVASSFFNILDVSPTIIALWQMDEHTLEDTSFQLFYHVRTSLDPKIIQVSGQNTSYILANRQTLGRINLRHPQTEGGMFTNVSIYTREGNQLVDNNRLTVTSKYPIGYDYYETDEGQVVV